MELEIRNSKQLTTLHSMRILLMVLFLLPTVLFSQDLRITVISAESKEPLPFANIYGKKSGKGASTNFEGIAIFDQSKLQARDSLLISYIGYKGQVLFYKKSKSAQHVTIAMETDGEILKEVVVTYEKPIKPVKVIKTAIKNTRQNYSTEDVIYNSLYRETIQEDGKYIQLNEGILQTYYTGYPQKKMDRHLWKDWYDDKTYAFDIEGYRLDYNILKDLNTKQDHQRILASRSSEDWSQKGLNYTSSTGPLLLFAFDKIKYQYDFFNPALLGKYNFKNENPEILHGEACHVISFYPKATTRKFHTDQSRKNKHPIYIGKMYITKESFALVKFEYHLAVERDFGFFEKSVPLDYHIMMEYKRKGDLYFIDKIKYKLTRVGSVGASSNRALLDVNKEIFVTSLQTKNVKPFPDSTVFKSTRYSALRYYRNKYNPSYWDNLEGKDPYRLSDKIISDLEKEKPLKEQFDEFNLSIKKDIPAPEAPKEHFVYDYPNEQILDSLSWMSKSHSEDKLLEYILAENEYADNELSQEKQYQRKIFKVLNEFYTEKEEQDTKRSVGTFFSAYDSLDNRIYYYQIDSTNSKKVLDITSFKYAHRDAYITSLQPNTAKDLIFVTYNKPGVSGAFVSVMPFGKNVEVDSFANVYSIQWASDTSILFAKEDQTERASRLFLRNLQTSTDSLVYYEKDKEYDVELEKSGEHLFCTLQSFSENEVYHINMQTPSLTLEMVSEREEGVMHSVYAKEDRVYLIANSETKGSSILSAPVDSLTQLSVLNQSSKNDFIEDILVLDDKIVALFFEKSIPTLKYLENGKKDWKKLKLKLGLGECTLLNSKNANSFQFYFSSPSNPGTTYQYDFANKALQVQKETKNVQHSRFAYNDAKRIWATGHDGVKIPMTLIKNRSKFNKNAGLILKVYGTYGSLETPYFNRSDAVLLSQGYTIAYAHVRGSAMMGSHWHKAGRELQKKNSILDYIACARHLVKEDFANSNSLTGYGTSAGAMIVAQAINLEPNLFNTVILNHPYLDVVNTMMNDELPGTISHYSELGNPNEKKVFEYMKGYSPYYNLKARHYPNVIVIAGYKDRITPVWQATNYVAKLRELNLSESKILLMTNLEEGHMSNASSAQSMKRDAKVYSFLRMTNPNFKSK